MFQRRPFYVGASSLNMTLQSSLQVACIRNIKAIFCHMIGPTFKFRLSWFISFVCHSCLIYEYMNKIRLLIFNKKLEIPKKIKLWLTPIRAVVYVIQIYAFSVSKWHRERDIGLVHTGVPKPFLIRIHINPQGVDS